MCLSSTCDLQSKSLTLAIGVLVVTGCALLAVLASEVALASALTGTDVTVGGQRPRLHATASYITQNDVIDYCQ